MSEKLGEDVETIRKVSDMMVTCHSSLRDSCSRHASTIDVIVLIMSAWLTAIAFAPDELLLLLNPFPINTKYLIGILATFTFTLTIFEMKLDFKGRREMHDAAARSYTRIKQKITQLSGEPESTTEEQLAEIRHQYSAAGEYSIVIPESKFLRLKANHRNKIEISRHLDKHPSTNLAILRVKMWIRDNFRSN